jgi:SAM-dependent methyltransferase
MQSEALRRQYEVEKELAARLRSSPREGRTELFKTLYGELFQRVPEHVRLTRRDTPEQSARAVEARLRLLRPQLRPDITLLEFAPGDCRLAAAAATLCKEVVAVDISDQHDLAEQLPDNLRLVIYDGYTLDVPDASVDVCFSYQFLEHLHPDDVDPHFTMAARVLKPGGCYVFDTPHRYSGPHDIAGLFGHKLECLHMQEWTCRDLRRIAAAHGFGRSYVFRRGVVRRSAILNFANDAAEMLCGLLPASLRRHLSRRLFGSVTLLVEKTS